MSELTPVTRKEQFLNNILQAAESGGGGGGGGFTPTDAQLAAMNSGITAEKLQTDENNISIVNITSEITVTSGYTLSTLSNVWKQGNHVWGQIIITLDSGEVAQIQTKIAQITRQYAPATTYISGCQLGGGIFDVRNNGYLFIRNNGESTGGEIIITTYNSGNTAINIHLDYTI